MKKYIPIAKKYIFRAFKVFSIVVLVLNLFFIFIYHPEFRTLVAKISTYSFRFLGYIIPIWLSYFSYVFIFPEHKIKLTYEFFRILIAVFFIIPLTIMTFVMGFFSSYANGSYDRCMEECVNEDKSNYDECAFSICDFCI